MVGFVVEAAAVAVLFAWFAGHAVHEKRKRHRRHVEKQLEAATQYVSFSDIFRIEQRRRRVHFASKNTEIPPREIPPLPAPWRSAYYEPARQRFETIVVDGVFMRHGVYSSSHNMDFFFEGEG